MEWDAEGPFGEEGACEEVQIVGEVRRRLLASITIVVGGAVFVMLYLGFYAMRFPWYSNLTVVLSTIAVVPALLLALWVHWGLGVAQRLAQHFRGPG
ncbi:MAG: hypothetical protein L3K03_03210 [Thermoplasmata archaeon]|nr:hypothetical protein [Thermoplasmata archaeon]